VGLELSLGVFCRSNKSKNGTGNIAEEEENEGLAMLIPNIQETASIVKTATDRLQKSTGKHLSYMFTSF
jgi:hypothetical protein